MYIAHGEREIYREDRYIALNAFSGFALDRASSAGGLSTAFPFDSIGLSIPSQGKAYNQVDEIMLTYLLLFHIHVC